MSNKVNPLFLKFKVIGHAVAVDIRLLNHPEPIRATVDCGGPVQAACLFQLMCDARACRVGWLAEQQYQRGYEDGMHERPHALQMPRVI